MTSAERIKQLAEWIAAVLRKEELTKEDAGYLAFMWRRLEAEFLDMDGKGWLRGIENAKHDFYTERCRYLEDGE